MRMAVNMAGSVRTAVLSEKRFMFEFEAERLVLLNERVLLVPELDFLLDPEPFEKPFATIYGLVVVSLNEVFFSVKPAENVFCTQLVTKAEISEMVN